VKAANTYCPHCGFGPTRPSEGSSLVDAAGGGLQTVTDAAETGPSEESQLAALRRTPARRPWIITCQRLAGIILLIGFVLPWGMVSCGGLQDVSESGITLAASDLQNGFGTEIIPASPWLLLLPLIGLVMIVRRTLRPRDLYLAAALATAAVVVTWVRTQQQLASFDAIYSVEWQPGIFATLIGIGMIWASGLGVTYPAAEHDATPFDTGVMRPATDGTDLKEE